MTTITHRSTSNKIKSFITSPVSGLALALLAVAVLTFFGPAERTLGSNVRVVYLHGAWVWAALIVFTLAAVTGALALISRKEPLHLWSRAMGRTGLVFWITYLPMSMWAMQTNWNGLFLAEPRWRFAVVFAIGGLILQLGVTLMEDAAWASAGNVIFWLAMVFALRSTEDVMHPGSPIFGSGATQIQVYFVALLLFTLLAALQLTRWWYRVETTRNDKTTL